MRIGFLQFSPEFGAVKRNLDFIAKRLEGVAADLVVLPELGNSGYLFVAQKEVASLAETVPGPTTEFLHEVARKNDVHLVLGLPERDGDRFYNSAVLVGPSGLIGSYRKVHLFYEEKRYFQPGNRGFPVFEFNGVKVGLLVCFDHLFPEAARALALQGAQLICHPSNLVLPTKAQLSTRVRAMENRLFWVLCNRFGTEDRGDKRLTYTGESQVVDPDGQVLVGAPQAGEALSVVEIDPAQALDKHVTRLNDLFEDRRPQVYQALLG